MILSEVVNRVLAERVLESRKLTFVMEHIDGSSLSLSHSGLCN